METTHFTDFKKCRLCKRKFLTNISRQVYCSKKCSEKAIRKILKKRYKDLLVGGETGLWLKMRFEVFKRDNFKCQYCGRNPIEDNCKLHIDHILPKNKGGTNKMSNLITACFECNEGKLDALLLEKQKENILKIIESKKNVSGA